jgi:glutamate racemase
LAPIEPDTHSEGRLEGAVGVFDSGIGGLSVLKVLRAEMPQERFIYWADSGHAPYGERSDDFVIARSHHITEQLLSKGPMKAVVVACNTATAVAIESLRTHYPDLPFIGVEPALKPALAQTQTGSVGVMGTQGTLNSTRFDNLLKTVQADALPKKGRFVLQACKGLALAIEKQTEKSLNDTTEVAQLCAKYVQSMGSFGHATDQIDTLVLGCTHYIFVQHILQSLVGPDVQLISTGEAVAKQTKRLITPAAGVPFVSSLSSESDKIELWTTGALSSLQAAALRWLDLPPRYCHQAATQSFSPP